jgi:hypothetical protein
MDDQNEEGEYNNLQGNIYSSFSGICSKILKSWTPKFFAKTSLGTCESQSVRRKVASSEKAPSLYNIRTNVCTVTHHISNKHLTFGCHRADPDIALRMIDKY